MKSSLLSIVLMLCCIDAVRADVVTSLDLSGQTSNGTLIADRFVIWCWHGGQPGGVQFADGTTDAVLQRWQMGQSDVSLMLLADSAPMSATRYPIFQLPTGTVNAVSPQITGIPLYTDVSNQGVGFATNVVLRSSSWVEVNGNTGVAPGDTTKDPATGYEFSQANGFYLVGGNSGFPTFAFADGEQALIGEHWAAYLQGVNGQLVHIGVDAAPGLYLPQIESIVSQYGENVNIAGVPEPRWLFLLPILIGIWRYTRGA